MWAVAACCSSASFSRASDCLWSACSPVSAVCRGDRDRIFGEALLRRCAPATLLRNRQRNAHYPTLEIEEQMNAPSRVAPGGSSFRRASGGLPQLAAREAAADPCAATPRPNRLAPVHMAQVPEKRLADGWLHPTLASPGSGRCAIDSSLCDVQRSAFASSHTSVDFRSIRASRTSSGPASTSTVSRLDGRAFRAIARASAIRSTFSAHRLPRPLYASGNGIPLRRVSSGIARVWIRRGEESFHRDPVA